MNIGLSQLLFVILICFLLFGNVSNFVYNINIFFLKLKEYIKK